MIVGVDKNYKWNSTILIGFVIVHCQNNADYEKNNHYDCYQYCAYCHVHFEKL